MTHPKARKSAAVYSRGGACPRPASHAPALIPGCQPPILVGTFPPFGGKHMQLETSRLGQSGLEITRVGIGNVPIGSNPSWSIYWGPQNESEAIRAIDVALDLGVNWIDTAPFYGWGRAEQIVGKALQGKRDRVYIFTKCGTLPNEQGGWREDLTPASIQREIEASLRRLQSDYIDLYQAQTGTRNAPGHSPGSPQKADRPGNCLGTQATCIDRGDHGHPQRARSAGNGRRGQLEAHRPGNPGHRASARPLGLEYHLTLLHVQARGQCQ